MTNLEDDVDPAVFTTFTTSRRKRLLVAVVVLLLPIFFTQRALTANSANPVSTMTTLQISTDRSSSASGSVVTMTAKVFNNSVPIQRGSVMFCNAKAAHCKDLALYGTAQLKNDGTATLKLSLGIGSYNIKAIYLGTPHSDPPTEGSTSTTQVLTIQGGDQPKYSE